MDWMGKRTDTQNNEIKSKPDTQETNLYKYGQLHFDNLKYKGKSTRKNNLF